MHTLSKFTGSLFATALLLLMQAPVCAAGDVPTEVTVTIKEYTFTPATVTVKVGGTVTWLNDEKRTSHSVWFKEPPADESERFFPGETWSRTFDKPGTYTYGCGPHPEMHGVVEVVP